MIRIQTNIYYIMKNMNSKISTNAINLRMLKKFVMNLILIEYFIYPNLEILEL